MTEQKLWHSPDETAKAGYIIVYLHGGSRPVGYPAGDYPGIIYSPGCVVQDEVFGNVKKWCYFSEFFRYPEALDRAIELLKHSADNDSAAPCGGVCSNILSEINEILKGGENE